MKALLCTQYGPPEALTLQTIADPQPGPGEVVVQMKAAGVNFPDVLIIQNKYQFKPQLPFAPGAEFSGVISAVGSGVRSRKVGDKVIGSVTFGAFAEQVCLPAERTIAMPEGLDFETAAALVLTYGTSWHALVDRAQLQAGETLLVLGASGGVGLAAIQIGRALGARVIAAASSAEKLAVCQQNGAHALIDYGREDLRERLKSLTEGRGPNVIYDPVGGPLTEVSFRSIAWRGRHLVVGFAQGDIPKLPLNLALLKGASLIGVFWGQYLQLEPAAFAADLKELFERVAAGELKPYISARYPLADGARALRELMDRRASGKLVIVP
ncbi:MAG: Quinone oxidoreductase 1 [Pseudomonadota bacterium]|jgi:NADPH2:quinone reductase